jgi:uncharacterized protein YdeI (YjbR/CyaY-like superfamily)
LFPGKKTAAEGQAEVELPEALKAKFEAEKMTPMSTSKMTLGDLPPDDRDQIMALIEADQAQQASQPRVIPITVGDLPEAQTTGENAQSADESVSS